MPKRGTHGHSTKAVILGNYSTFDNVNIFHQEGVDTYAFNLSVLDLQRHGIIPRFLWATSPELCRAHTKFFGVIRGLADEKSAPQILIPTWFIHHFSTEEVSRHMFVDLRPFGSAPWDNAISLQAAAVWWTAWQGYKTVDCCGFDHFFEDGKPSFLQAEAIAGAVRFLGSAGAGFVHEPKCRKITFHKRSRAVSLGNSLLDAPRGLSQASFTLPQHASDSHPRKFAVSGQRRQTSRQKRQRTDGRHTPLVSLLICIKNSEHTLRACLDAVAAQSYSNFECVVVDGASSDRTLEILEEYRWLLDTVISEPDSGYYEAMNKAVGMATGDYLLVVNGDDTVESTALEKLVNQAVTSGCEITAAHAITLGEDGEENGRIPSFWNGSCPIRCPLRHGTMLVSRATYERVGLYDASKKVIADRMWMERALQLGVSVSIVDEYLLHFRTTGISSLTSHTHVSEIDRGMLALEPSLSESVLDQVRFPWELATDELITLCRKYPLSGPFRQALFADRRRELLGSDWPDLSVIIPTLLASDEFQRYLQWAVQLPNKNTEILLCGPLRPEDRQLVRDYAVKDLRLLHIDSDRSTYLRTGLMHANGHFLFLCSSDPLPSFESLGSICDGTISPDSHLLCAADESDNKPLVWSENHALLADWAKLVKLSPRESCAHDGAVGLVISRHIYKRGIAWIGSPSDALMPEKLRSAVLLTSLFSLFPQLVWRIDTQAISSRLDALAAVLSEVRQIKRLRQNGVLGSFVSNLESAALTIVPSDIASNHRLSLNTRLHLISFWSEKVQRIFSEHQDFLERSVPAL